MVMKQRETPHYDYGYAEDDSGHLYEIFRVRDGKRVAWAESEREALERIDSLERRTPTTKEASMTLSKTLTTQILFGLSLYPIGTKVQCSEVIDEGTRDERVWVTFPHGEGAYLKPDCVR